MNSHESVGVAQSGYYASNFSIGGYEASISKGNDIAKANALAHELLYIAILGNVDPTNDANRLLPSLDIGRKQLTKDQLNFMDLLSSEQRKALRDKLDLED
jgi:hypothetical protein